MSTFGVPSSLLLVLVTLLNVLNIADRFLMISFANAIMADLGLSHFQFTLLTGFAFTVFFVVAGLFMGMLADRTHRPRLMAAGLFLWSALTAATGAAMSFAQVAVARAFIGVGEATLTPTAVSMLADAYPVNRRALVTSLYFLGVPIGTSLSYFLAATAGERFGWRACFLGMGLIGVVASLALLLISDQRRKVATEDNPPSFADFLRFARQSRVLWLVTGGSMLMYASFGTLVMDQVWLVKERGYTVAEAQRFTGLIFLLGGVAGSLTAGWLSDAWNFRGNGGRLLFLITAYGLAVPISLAYRFLPSHTLGFACACFLGSMSVMWLFGPALATLQDIVPDRFRATSVAFFLLCVQLLGYAPGAVMSGWLADRFTAAGVAEPITWALAVAASPALLAAPMFWAAYRCYAAEIKPTIIVAAAAA